LTLWDFAAAAWRRPGVEAICLELQNRHGQSPPLLLWRLWLVSEGRSLSAEALAEAIATARTWQAEVVAPLRSVRDRLASPLGGAPETARLALRRTILAAELEAERILLAGLEMIEAVPDASAVAPLSPLLVLTQAWGTPAPTPLLARLITTTNDGL
jgi:uncharacterized protein (TIGR02444 family)